LRHGSTIPIISCYFPSSTRGSISSFRFHYLGFLNLNTATPLESPSTMYCYSPARIPAFSAFSDASNTDTRWKGNVRKGPYTLLVIAVLAILYLFFTLVQFIYAGANPPIFAEVQYLNPDGSEYAPPQNQSVYRTSIKWDYGPGFAAWVLCFLLLWPHRLMGRTASMFSLASLHQ
jgi:hypothetical protein